MNKELLRKYAQVAIYAGCNVQKGQLLVINGSVKDNEFIEMCTEEAYKKGAGRVMVNWSDEFISKQHYLNCDLETLKDYPDWQIQRKEYEINKGCCYLHVISDTPGYFDDVDQIKYRETAKVMMQKTQHLRYYTMSNYGQWSIVALPSIAWAKKVFPDKEDSKAVELLTEAILKSVRISEDNDPIKEWEDHSVELKKHCDILNNYQFDKLHFVSELGTDLYVGLVKNHVWAGGSSETVEKKIVFNPNMPTEEIFCMPDRNNVNGIVYASKPLSYAGNVVEDFWFKFENGEVIDYGAKKAKEALTTLLSVDEGAKHLGEVALIGYDSPISLMDILFYETLFDENASCHLALGACYPENIENGINMSKEELLANGGNDSMEHCDFMFGTKDMNVYGITKDNKEVQIFKDGNFII